MKTHSVLKRRIGFAIVSIAVAGLVVLVPTTRIYLCGASTKHLKSGEWVFSGPTIGMSDIRFGYLVNAITDRKDISCLRLSNPTITDSGFSPVAKLKTLRWISIVDSQMTDEALVHFRELNGLRKLCFNRCPNLSESSIDDLRESLPDCTIYVDANGP